MAIELVEWWRFPSPSSPISDENPKTPEKSVRLGNISASVFLNQAESGRDFRSVVFFQLSYRTESGDRRFANSFTASDLPVLERVLKLAQEHVEELEAIVEDVTRKLVWTSASLAPPGTDSRYGEANRVRVRRVG